MRLLKGQYFANISVKVCEFFSSKSDIPFTRKSQKFHVIRYLTELFSFSFRENATVGQTLGRKTQARPKWYFRPPGFTAFTRNAGFSYEILHFAVYRLDFLVRRECTWLRQEKTQMYVIISTITIYLKGPNWPG